MAMLICVACKLFLIPLVRVISSRSQRCHPAQAINAIKEEIDLECLAKLLLMQTQDKHRWNAFHVKWKTQLQGCVICQAVELV